LTLVEAIAVSNVSGYSIAIGNAIAHSPTQKKQVAANSFVPES